MLRPISLESTMFQYPAHHVPFKAMAVRLFIAHFIQPQNTKYSYLWHRFSVYRFILLVCLCLCVCVKEERMDERMNGRTEPGHSSKQNKRKCLLFSTKGVFKREIIIKINDDIFIVMDNMC